MNYNGTEYFYITDMQGNIIEMVDISGNTVVKYKYDAWGNIVYQYDSGLGIDDINPFRYRGYYLDKETGYYYLQSRYYNPEIGRFISGDTLVGIPADILSHNMYAYGGNNPVNNVDPFGNSWYNPFSWSAKTWMIIGSAVSIVAGAALIATGTGSVAGAALLTAGANSLATGISNEVTGGSFEVGWTIGYVSGAIAGAGMGIGAQCFTLIETTGAQALIQAVGISFSMGFGAGGLKSVALDLANGREVDTQIAFATGLYTGSFNVLGAMFGTSVDALGQEGLKAFAFLAAATVEGAIDIASYALERLIEYFSDDQTEEEPAWD